MTGEPRAVDSVLLALREGWPDVSVASATTAAEAVATMSDRTADLVVVEHELLNEEAARAVLGVRSASAVPIIVTAGLYSDSDLVKYLELGADAYVARTLDTGVLAARARAIMRRTESGLTFHS